MITVEPWNPGAVMLGVLLLAALIIVPVILWEIRKAHDWHSFHFRFGSLTASGLLLFLLYWALPLFLAPEYAFKGPMREFDTTSSMRGKSFPPSVALPRPSGFQLSTTGSAISSLEAARLQTSVTARQNLILAELKKVNDEIQLRIQQGDEWFYRKFLMLGGLLAALLGFLGTDLLGAFRSGGTAPVGSRLLDLESRLAEVMRSNVTCSVLALATVLAISIDLQTKLSDTIVHQLALWIHNFAEPAFLGSHDPDASPPGFIAYETYLRLPGEAMHTDHVAKLVFHSQAFFFTGPIYLIYVMCLQRVCLRTRHNEDFTGLSIRQQRLALASFVLVHVYLALFAYTAHSAPSAFWFSTPFGRVNGELCGWLFLLAPVLLVVLHRPFWNELRKGSFVRAAPEAKPKLAVSLSPEPSTHRTIVITFAEPTKDAEDGRARLPASVADMRLVSGVRIEHSAPGPVRNEAWSHLVDAAFQTEDPDLPPDQAETARSQKRGSYRHTLRAWDGNEHHYRAVYLTAAGEAGPWSNRASLHLNG